LEKIDKSEFTRVERAKGLSLWLCYQSGLSFWNNMAGGMVLTGLLLELGAKDGQIGLLGSLAYIGSMTQLIALNISRRVSNQKRWWLLCQGVARFLYAGLAIVGFTLSKNSAVSTILLIVGMANLISALSSPVTNAWYMEILSPSLRASFISRQNLVTVTSSIVAGLLVGRLLDIFPGSKGFYIAYGLSLAVACIMQFFLRALPFYDMPLGQTKGAVNVKKTGVKEISQDKTFMAFTVFFNSWVLVTTLMAPFTNVYYLKVISMPYSTLAILNAVANFSALVTYPIWGYLINRYGNKPAMGIAILWAMVGNVALILSTKEYYSFLFPVVAIGAILSAGHGIAANNMYYGLLPHGEKRASYMAFYSTVQGSIGLIGPIIGGYLATSAVNLSFQLFGITIDYLRILYFGQIFLYLILFFALQRLKDEGALGLREFIGEIKTKAPVALLKGMLFSSKSPRTSTRVEGVKDLGRTGSPLATERLVEALDDSSVVVRREAIRSLSELKALYTVPELISRLKDPEYGHEVDIIRALGQMGDARARVPLIEFLRSHTDDEGLTIETIVALGTLGGEEARSELVHVLKSSTNTRIQVSTIEALANLGDSSFVPTAMELIEEEALSRRAQMRVLVSLARIVGVEEEFYRLMSLPELEAVVRFSKLLSNLRRNLSPFSEKILSGGDIRTKEEMLRLAADLLEAYQMEDEALFGEAAEALVGNLLEVTPREGASREIILDILTGVYDSGVIRKGAFPITALVILLSHTLIIMETEGLS
jgi:MFS family permease